MITAENGLVLLLGGEETGSELGHLLQSSGFRARLVLSPDELLPVAKSISPDVILIQVTSTGFNYEVCRALKSDPFTTLISLLVLSTDITREDRLMAIQAGVDDYILRPFDNDEVVLRLRNAVVRARQARELQSDAVKIQQLEEARAELTQLVVHEMKTPLTGLADLLELSGGAASKDFKGDASRFVNEALGATETLEEMVDFLMSVRKMMAGEETPIKQPCEILQLARYVSEALAELAQAAGVMLEVDGDFGQVLCDKFQMTRVIRHLIRVAIKARPLEGKVRVRVKRVSGRVKLFVSCEGGTRDAVIETAGLGLTFCRLVAAGHGGDFGIPLPASSSVCWWITLPEVTTNMQTPASGPVAEPVALERSRRYLGKIKAKSEKAKSRSLFSMGTRQQFSVVVALMSVIPLLAFAYVLGDAIRTQSLNMETLFLLLPSIVTMMALGIMLLARHIIEVNRLRQYLETVSRGGNPGEIMDPSSEDFVAIQRSLGTVIKQGAERVQVIEAQSKALVHAEQQRVMAETVGAACHHLGQPASIIRGYLDLMKRAEVSPEMRAMIQECQMATEEVATVLSRLKGVGQYETEPYLTAKDERRGRSDERILKI